MLDVKKYSLNQMLYLLLGIIFLFIISVSIVLFAKNKILGVVKEDDVSLVASSYVVSIDDKLSVSDDFGKSITDDNAKSFGYVDLEIHNTVDNTRNFQLYITEKDTDNEINPNYVKFYLTDEDDIPFTFYSGTKLPSYVELNYLVDKPSSKLLYTGILDGNETKKFKLRVWLTDSYIVENSEKTFNFDISVRAI